MLTIPKIVLSRLKAAAPAGNHPEADALTAFAERSLTERERSTVIEHLARCGDCREIVALALPAIESVEPVIAANRVSSGRVSRFAWPVLRWGFAAVGVVAIASFGILELQRSHKGQMADLAPRPENSVARNEAPALPAVPAASKPAAKEDKISAALAASVPGPRTPLSAPESGARVDTLTASNHQPQPGGVVGGQIIRGPRASMQQQQQQQRVPAPSSPPAVAKQEAGDASGARQSAPEPTQTLGEAIQTEAQNQLTVLPEQAAQPQALDDDSAVRMSKAKAPMPSGAAGANAPQGAADQSTGGAALRAQSIAAEKSGANGRNFGPLVATTSGPRWTISSRGGLQRSFDEGNTWQDVNVLALAGPSDSAMSFAVVSRSASTDELARAKEKDSEKKSAKRETSPVIFRAVTATGTEVWAGGSQGVLYHSVDSGNHWSRVVLSSSSGGSLTGDILAVEFADTLHGKVTTSTSELWVTADAGQTWQRQ